MVSRNAVQNEILRLKHALQKQLKEKTESAGIGLTTVFMTPQQELGQKMLVNGCPKAFVEFFQITTTLQPEPTNAEDEAAGIRFPVAELQRTLKTKEVLEVLYKHLVSAEMGDRVANFEQLFDALAGAGDLFDRTFYLETSITYYARALAAAQKIVTTRNTSHVAKAKYNLGKLHWKMENSTEAIACLEQAVELASFINDGQRVVLASKDLLEIYWDCAEDCREQSDLNKSIALFDKCVAMGKACGDATMRGEAKYNAGLLYSKLKDFDKAGTYQLEYLSFVESMGDKEGECKAHAAMSENYEAQKDVKQAVEHLKSFISVAASLDLSTEAIGHCLLGSLYHRQGDREGALEEFGKYFDIARDLQEPDILDVSRVNSGIARGHGMRPAVNLGDCPYWSTSERNI